MTNKLQIKHIGKMTRYPSGWVMKHTKNRIVIGYWHSDSLGSFILIEGRHKQKLIQALRAIK